MKDAQKPDHVSLNTLIGLSLAKTLSGPDNADFDESAFTITGGARLPLCSPVSAAPEVALGDMRVPAETQKTANGRTSVNF